MAMDLSVLALSVVRKGEGDIPGLTDRVEPKRLGPKRATKIRRFFGLTKDDDVCFVLPAMMGLVGGSMTDTFGCASRSANSSSVAKFNPKAKERNRTPKLPRSNVSSLLNVFSTSAVVLH